MNYTNKLLILGLFLISVTASAVDCDKNPIYCKIVKLRPDIDKEWAMELSNIVYKKSKKYGLDPFRSIAIAMQESSLRPINRQKKVLVSEDVCNKDECETRYFTVTGYTDLSLWQFHISTVEDFNMDYKLIQEDLEYATDFHFKLMKHKIELCSDLGKDAWTCYHSRTPKHRETYKKMVNRYYYKSGQKERPSQN